MNPGIVGSRPSPPAPALGPAVFDVCHGGVVLRALLCVHGVVALVLAWQSAGPRAWLDQVSLLAVVLLPATLAWLWLACAAQARLAAWPRWAYWSAALGLGALCAAAAGGAWQLLSLSLALGAGLADTRLGWFALCCAVTGAAFAAAMVHWLEQRSRLRQPVDTHARLAELQARIRPHFLFNALNSAVALVQVDPARAEAVLEDLSDLFRAALHEGGREVSLGEELALARRYLSIEQVRFGERLRVHWQLDPAAEAAQLPPLVLQPLVENAVRHGIEPAQAGGDLWVHTALARGQVVVHIRNTLPGPADAGAAAPRAEGHGMALRNVRERLYLMHDVRLGFEAGAERGGGHWLVRIAVPLAG